jgi:hypothetical protein
MLWKVAAAWLLLQFTALIRERESKLCSLLYKVLLWGKVAWAAENRQVPAIRSLRMDTLDVVD